MINTNVLAAASFMPGLQNAGTVSGTALINGTLDASPNFGIGITSNMTNANGIPIIITLQIETAIT